MLNKKSQGLSINSIIIAALGLIGLVIIGLIFRGESVKFAKSMDCTSKDGICLSDMGGEDCPADKSVKIYTNDCAEMKIENGNYVKKEPKKSPGQCCIPLG